MIENQKTNIRNIHSFPKYFIKEIQVIRLFSGSREVNVER